MTSDLKGVLRTPKVPKPRDLNPGKKYRETVKKWGEPENFLRKRVIIVPDIACEARNVRVELDQKEKSRLGGPVSSSFDSGILSGDRLKRAQLTSQYDQYKTWIAERKKLRNIITQSGLSQGLLEKKSGKTPLEKRVLKRMKRVLTPDIRVRNVIPDVVSPEQEESSTGVDKGVPTIHHPSPAALAVIQEYLDRKRMRLVDLFAQADKDKNWIVSREEFRKIIRTSGIPLSDSDLEDLIMALDKDDNDALDYSELSTGRQAYLEERFERQSPSMAAETRKANTREPLTEGSKDDFPQEGIDSRPTSPQLRSPPHSPTLKDALNREGSSIGVERRPSSPSLLEIPATVLSEKVEKVSLDEIKTIRLRKQQKRKEREKAKQKQKQPEKPSVAPSTLGGTTGAIVDRYRQRTVQEYNDTVNLCDMHGIQLSKALLGRVLLQPEDKPISKCLPKIQRSGLFSISTRHHVPTSYPPQIQKFNPDWTP